MESSHPSAKQIDPNIKFEKFKYVVELIKWFIVSVALVIVTTIIDSGFKDRSAGIQEIQQYDKYVTDLIVLNKEIAPRRLLAQYFANVTASDKLREQWKQYYKVVDAEYQQYLKQDSIIKIALLNIALRTSDTLKIYPDITEGKGSNKTQIRIDRQKIADKIQIENLQQKANEINRQLNANIKIPTNSNVTLTSASIVFITAGDDKDMDTKIIIIVKSSNGQPIINAKFNDNATYGNFSAHSLELPISNQSINKNDVINGTLIIQILPNGNDTWKFTPSLKMKFSDGTEVVQNNFSLISLSNDNNQISLGF